MTNQPPPPFRAALATLVEGRDLDAGTTRALLEAMISGRAAEAETAAVLVALRMKGETADELAAAAGVLREHMVRLETGRDDVLDTCGTGGDGSGTFNISTAAALVAAGAGVPVVKHGNRSVTSRSGSADVLAALGVHVEGDVAWARRCLECAGLAFCFAPHFHPALRHVGAVRSRLGVRTLFNCLGPLANPAGAAFQLLGVGHARLLDPVAGALARLGTRRAVVVCGSDGLDEVTLAGATAVRLVQGGRVSALEWQPESFGLEPAPAAALAVAGPAESAALIREVLAGAGGQAARVVLANAGAALVAAGRAAQPAEGVTLAAEAVRSGRARQVLERLVACAPEGAGLSKSPREP